jgi:hypothetical protein
VQGLLDEVLGDVGAVGVGGVDEGDAQVDGATQDADRLVVVLRRAPDALTGDAHGAVAEAVDGLATEVDGSAGGDGHGFLLEFSGGFPSTVTPLRRLDTSRSRLLAS